MSNLLTLIVAVMMLASVGNAGVITLTFNEQPFQTPAQGLTEQGVTFELVGGDQFDYPFYYNDNINIPLTLLTDPVLDGPADGTVNLVFTNPTTTLTFNLVVVDPTGLGTTASVALSGPGFTGTSPQSVALSADSLSPLSSDGTFSYSGSPITQASITFAIANGPFGLDNLSFEVPDSSVPEPGSFPLLLAGGFLMAMYAGIRRYRATHAG